MKVVLLDNLVLDCRWQAYPSASDTVVTRVGLPSLWLSSPWPKLD